jgi:hypothetical protein
VKTIVKTIVNNGVLATSGLFLGRHLSGGRAAVVLAI